MMVHAMIRPSVRCQRLPSGCSASQLTCRPIEVSQIERMGMICLPSGEEHGQHRDDGREGAELSRSKAHGCHLQHASQCAIQRVDAVATKVRSARGALGREVRCVVLEELAQRAGRASAAGLLAVDVVHGGVPARQNKHMFTLRAIGVLLTSTCRKQSYSTPMKAPAIHHQPNPFNGALQGLATHRSHEIGHVDLHKDNVP